MRGRRTLTGFGRIAAALLVAIAPSSCAIQQPPAAAPTAAVRPLPFKGRLTDGNPNELPPAVATSLSNDSKVRFSYREELTHEEHHPPMLITAFDPLTYAGYPMGEYDVTAFASLSIFDGDRLIGDYSAQTRVTRPYSLYSQPTHRELDDAARAAVREEIDQKLYSDVRRLSEAVAAPAAVSREPATE